MARKKAEPAEATPASPEQEVSHADQHEAEGTKPVMTFRIGRLWCNVWERHHPEQGAWYSVSITRSYRDSQNQWQRSHSMGKDDLLPFAELARMAFHWITERFQSGHDRNGGLGEAGSVGIVPFEPAPTA